MQAEGGTAAAIGKGIELVSAMLERANGYRREPVPVSELIVGLNCGGSDGYSGITANPALGGASDLLVAHGATTILSETPEIYGAEHLLTRRAATPEIACGNPDYVLFNARATYTFDERFSVALWGKNLTNELTTGSAFNLPAPITAVPRAILYLEPPRNLSIEAGFKF